MTMINKLAVKGGEQRTPLLMSNSLVVEEEEDEEEEEEEEEKEGDPFPAVAVAMDILMVVEDTTSAMGWVGGENGYCVQSDCLVV